MQSFPPSRLLLGIGLAVFLAANAALADDGIQEVRDVEVGHAGDRVLHADLAFPGVRPPAPMPVVLWIHGGGWRGGSYHGNPARALAARGYFTASIEYRLSSEAVWPAQIADCKQAVRWLRAHAADYGVDPARIGVWGQSAGGYLACCLATLGPDQGFDTGEWPGESSRVQAVLDWSGPADFHIGKGVYAWALGPLFGDPALRDDAKLRAASPVNHIVPGLPPFLIVHGDCDWTVPYAESFELKAALDKAGVPAELLTVHGGDHTYHPVPGGPAPVPDGGAIQAAGFAFFDRTLK